MTGGQVGTAASRTGAGGINATVSGTVGGIDITSTNVFSTGTGINATLDGATSRNIAITTNGVTNSSTGTGIVAGITNAGASGNIAITQNGAVTRQRRHRRAEQRLRRGDGDRQRPGHGDPRPSAS